MGDPVVERALAIRLERVRRRIAGPGQAGWDALDRHRDGAAATETQRGETVATLAPGELVEQRRDDPRSRRPDRMAERDRPAVDVDLVPVEAELPSIGERLGGEGLVDLDQVERLERQLDPVQQPLDAL